MSAQMVIGYLHLSIGYLGKHLDLIQIQHLFLTFAPNS